MADHFAEKSVHKSLVGGVVDKVIITGRSSGLEVLNRSTDQTIYFRLDGIDPVVSGDNTRVVPPLTGWSGDAPDTKTKEIRLISSGNSDYSVQSTREEE